MRFKKILFVQAKYDSTFSNVLPAGIGYLSEFLSSHGIENDVFDLNVPKYTEGALHDKVAEFKPDIVGLSIMSLNYRHNYDAMSALKKTFPHLAIAAGGAHVSTMREDVLKDCQAIDYGITLEGEHTLLELMKWDNDISRIRGLLHRIDGRVAYNGDRPFMKDLDSMPFPRYGKFNKQDYSTLISVFTSRGCPFECTYCPVMLAVGRRFITRSAKVVVDEIEYHYSQGYREFSFRDDNFTLIPQRVYDVCDEIEKRGFEGLYLMCDNGVRADKIDYQMLKRMKDVGFRMIGIGVESGSDKVLKGLKKSSTAAIMDRAIKTACESGYIVELYFLIGAPGETWQDFEESVRLAVRYPVLIASFYHLLPYPKTELFDFVTRNKYLLRGPEEYLNDGSQRRNTPFFTTPEFSYEERKKAFDYAYEVTSPYVRKARSEYSRRSALEVFSAMGLPGGIAGLFARIYSSDIVRTYILNKHMAGAMKNIFKRRAMYGRVKRSAGAA